MSSGHERDRPTFHHQPPAPEVPRRIRTHNANGNPHGHPAIREIHKNAWLKRQQSPHDKKGAAFIRKFEKHWVVFCVHDDVEAFLEFYSEPKMGAAHKPTLAVSLNTCLHVSPSIIGQDNEYEFAVTLPNQVIRLFAANWEQMIEWVESLQGKLREMNILCPKDNLYSKLPDSFPCPPSRVAHNNALVTTRDPNSPLPPPPGIRTSPTPSVPGAELPRPSHSLNRSSGSSLLEPVVRSSDIPNREIPALPGPPPGVKKRQRNPTDSTLQLTASSSGSSSRNVNGETASSALRIVQPYSTTNVLPDSGVRVQENEHTVVHLINRVDESRQELVADELVSSCENVSLNGRQTVTSPDSSSSTVCLFVSGENGSASTSVVQVTFPEASENNLLPAPSSKTNSVSIAAVSNNNSNTESQSPAPSTSSCSMFFPSFSTSENPASHITEPNNSQLVTSSEASSTSMKINDHPSICVERLQSSSAAVSQRSVSKPQENVYEHLFIPTALLNTSDVVKSSSMTDRPSSNGDGLQEDGSEPPLIPRRNPQSRRHNNRSSTGSSAERSSKSAERGDASGTRKVNSANVQSNRGEKRHGRSRHADIIRPVDSPFTESDVPTSSSRGQCLGVLPMEAMIGVRSGEYRIRRDDVNTPGSSVHANGDSESRHKNAAHLPLKEQQVMRLKAEIHHAGGVRIVLRKKDCLNSIAFVDYLGAVWIAGWRQQQHPVLYYAFHVGDQILKVAGVTVHNSAEAQLAIKMVSSMQVEFIIRRLPFGRVLVLKRSKEGEPLGLVSEGNSGEIGEVVSNGLAASHGLPPRGPSTDGQSACNWFLTEINNRPLSLMAKETEVRERLNAVGKEISILVQPADLVKHLRKQLKTVKNYKDYLIV